MHIFNNIRNYLYDNDNFIAILDNRIYIYNIMFINDISSNKLIVSFKNKKVSIIGDNLKVIRSINSELELVGNIRKVLIDEIIN